MEKSKVLIIEDEVIVAHDLADMLTEWGYETVGMVSSGEEAVKRAQATKPDLVLADIRLEGAMDGIEASQRIRAHSDAAIVYLTARTESEVFERAKETGPYGYLTKPVAPQELLRTVEMAMYKSDMERRLRESEEKFAKAFQFSGVPMAISAIKDGLFVEVNDALVNTFGYEKYDLIGKTSVEAGLWVRLQQRDAIRKQLMEKGFVRDVEVTMRTGDGGLRQGLLSGTIIQLRGGTFWINSFKDITELKAAEERFRIAAQTATDLIYEWDTTSDTLQWFGDVDAALGLLPGELKLDVDSWISRTHPDDLPRMLEAVEHHRRSTEPFDYEYRIQREDGTWRYWSGRGAPVLDENGRPRKWIGVCTDITEKTLAEASLKESEEKFRTIFEGATDGIFGVDAQTRRGLVASPSICSLTGYSESEMLQLRVDDLHPAQDLPLVLDQFHKLLEGEIAVARDIPVLKKDGAVVYCDISTGYSRYGDQDVFFGFFRDVTDRKHTEDALRSERRRFETLAENIPFGMVMVGEDGDFLYVNPKFGEMFGYDPAEITCGREWFRRAFPDPKYRQEVIKAWIEDLKSSAQREQRPRVFTVTCKDGTERSVHFRPVQVETGGHLMTCEDITDWTRQQQALRESEQMFRLLSEQSLLAVAILQDGYYEYVNQAMTNLVEYTAEEMKSLHYTRFFDAVVHPEDHGFVMEQAKRKQEGDPGQITSYTFRIRTKSGAVKWVEIYSKTIQFQGENANLLAMIDITDRKYSEEHLRQSQKMEAIGTLAGGIAHDVNNLLQIILGQADMLLFQKRVDEKGHDAVEAIRKATLNGSELVRRILAFSRQEETEMRPVHLNDEIRRVGELLRRTIPRMVSIEMALGEDVRMIRADTSQLEQILLNLAVNATDAMPDGGRLIFETRNETIREEYCRIHAEAKPGKYVLLAVSDTGHGMHKHVSERIFEPFFTTKEPGHGTGLGLSMVFGIVKNHRGHIHCYSEYGVGTIFKIYFPVAQIEEKLAAADTIEMPAGGTETLLLVDDEENVRNLGAEMLELAGYRVLTAANGREALTTYEQNKDQISLVILDLVMPEMSGRRCLEALRDMNPKARVLIASGYAADGPVKETRESGAAGFISKPFDLKQILLAVRQSLDRDPNEY